MKWVATVVCVVFGGGIAFGCADRTNVGAVVTDTNTNWLQACDSESECGSLDCLCGVCTTPCEETRQCAGFGTTALCRAVSAADCEARPVCVSPEFAERHDGCPTNPPRCVNACGQTLAPQCADGNWVCSENDDMVCTSSSEPLTTAATSSITEESGSSSSPRTEVTIGWTSAGQSSAGESAETGGSDATSDGSATSGERDPCLDAVAGATCSSDGVTCGGPCTDMCQFCNLTRCQNGTWQRMEVFPAPCFECGDALTCVATDSYCRISNGASYSCEPLPAACARDRSCECLQAQEPGISCSGANGELTVERAGPIIVEQCECRVWLEGSAYCNTADDTEGTGRSVEWECGTGAPLAALNAECSALPTGAARWCCPTAFEPICD